MNGCVYFCPDGARGRPVRLEMTLVAPSVTAKYRNTFNVVIISAGHCVGGDATAPDQTIRHPSVNIEEKL